MSAIAPIIPVYRERLLRREETRILTVARQPGFQSDPAIAAQLQAYAFAENLHDIHDVTAAKYEDTDLSHRVPIHRDYAEKAHQLKLLALDILETLTRP
jgi:hypothetical protein